MILTSLLYEKPLKKSMLYEKIDEAEAFEKKRFIIIILINELI